MFKKGFTLVEIMIGILITSTIIIIGFQALTTVTVGKIKLIESTNIEKETFLFTQKLFEEIKAGGLIDYEEYFNRKVVGNTSYASGHYNLETGFGNFGNGGIVGSNSYGDGFYYCRSGDGNQMGTGGCVEHSGSTSYAGESQRYGQYSFQFIDYNSNADSDLGDEDGNTKIIGDDDDEYLGEGPIVFTGGTDIKELYLISGDKTKRTIFRWNVGVDLNKPSSSSCNTTDGKTFTGTGCLGTIEFLRLEGKDWGMDHTLTGLPDTDGTQYDGVIDTWIISPDFIGGGNIVAGSTGTGYWLPLFSDTINVANFEVYAYPNKDIKHAWKDYSPETNLSPYVRLKLKLTPSWKVKKKIKGKIPEFEINTTISLTDIYSR